MDNSRRTSSASAVVVSQLLVGQIAGTAYALLLFLIELMFLYRDSHPFLGASLLAVLTVYLLFGWILGGVVGFAAGSACALWKRLKPGDGRACGTGPLLGFLFTALYLLRDLTLPQLRLFPPSVVVAIVVAAIVWIGIAFLSRRVSVRSGIGDRSRARFRSALALVVLVSVVVTLGLSFMESRRLPRASLVPDSSPNVVLIVVDALRPDHISAYGYDRNTTPNLARLANGGALFTKAYSHGNRTIISMPSLFTSLYPSFHGAVGIKGLAVPLPQSKVTIAELLRDAGYTTVGLMSNIYLKNPYGLTQGFDIVEEYNVVRFNLSVYRLLETLGVIALPPYRHSKAPNATVVTDSAIKWVNRLSAHPFFVFLHYMDVHHPYELPDDHQGTFGGENKAIDPGALFLKTAKMVRTQPPLELPAPELQQLIDEYDNCIHYTDYEIGRLIRVLEELSGGRETVVIFTADHGDEFLEHGSLYHTNLLVEELIRVPLIIWHSNAAPAGDKIETLVGHVDVLPTVAELIGTVPPEEAVGTSLVPLLRGVDTSHNGYSIAEGDYCVSLNTESWKLMYVDSTGTYELYDLSTDPQGMNDVSVRYPDQLEEMRGLLEDYLQSAREVKRESKTPVSSEALRQLKALGYVQ